MSARDNHRVMVATVGAGTKAGFLKTLFFNLDQRYGRRQ
jgi:hypothetical protein